MTEDEETDAMIDVLADICIDEYLKKRNYGKVKSPCEPFQSPPKTPTS